MTRHQSTHPTPGTAEIWRYRPTAVVLHWTVALLLVLAVGLGWYMMSIEHEPGSDWYFNTHKSLGITIALLVLIRIAFRLTHPPEELPAHVPRWQARLAKLTQIALYVVIVLMPATGYLGASHTKAGVAFLGAQTPRWAVPDHDTAEWFFSIHSTLVWVLVALVSLHVIGALKHLLVDRDRVFSRMGFRGRR